MFVKIAGRKSETPRFGLTLALVLLLCSFALPAAAGPLIGGQAMDITGPRGFFIVMAAVYVLYGGYAFWRTTRREAVDPDERTDFRPLGINKTPTPETYALDMRSDPEAMAEKAEDETERTTVWGYDFS